MVRKIKKALKKVAKTKKLAAPAHGKFYLLLLKLVGIIGDAVAAYERRLRLHAREKEVLRRENLVQCELDAIDNVKAKLEARRKELDALDVALVTKSDELQALEEELAREKASVPAKVNVSALVKERLDKIEEALENIPTGARVQGYAIVQEKGGTPRIEEVTSRTAAERLVERVRSGEIELLF